MRTGEEAKAVGRAANAKSWSVNPPQDSQDSHRPNQGELGT
jgi:hypothetical protein